MKMTMVAWRMQSTGPLRTRTTAYIETQPLTSASFLPPSLMIFHDGPSCWIVPVNQALGVGM